MTDIKPRAWAHTYSPNGLIHNIHDKPEWAEHDVAICGGTARVVELYTGEDLAAAVAQALERRAEYDAALVAAERERCLRILQSVNNSDNPMTASDCADLIASGKP